MPQPLSWMTDVAGKGGRSWVKMWLQTCSELFPIISLKRAADLGYICLGANGGRLLSCAITYIFDPKPRGGRIWPDKSWDSGSRSIRGIKNHLTSSSDLTYKLHIADNFIFTSKHYQSIFVSLELRTESRMSHSSSNRMICIFQESN